MMGEKDGVARGDTLGTSKATNTKFHQTLGNKAYELSNHLGNILAVIADNKYKIGAFYEAKILSETDYYAYGMQMHGRIYQAGAYRFGLNGQEKSRVIGLSTYSAEFWEYDSRSGIRWNIDPIFDPNFSPYATFGNNPIIFSDPNGDKPCTDCDREAYKKDGLTDEQIDAIPNGLGEIVVKAKSSNQSYSLPDLPDPNLPDLPDPGKLLPVNPLPGLINIGKKIVGNLIKVAKKVNDKTEFSMSLEFTQGKENFELAADFLAPFVFAYKENVKGKRFSLVKKRGKVVPKVLVENMLIKQESAF